MADNCTLQGYNWPVLPQSLLHFWGELELDRCWFAALQSYMAALLSLLKIASC